MEEHLTGWARLFMSTLARSSSRAHKRNNGDNGGSDTPYLYFIALGLGIVFMNFWVFLGIRHCMRHRQEGRFVDADGNSISVTGPNGEMRSVDTDGALFFGLSYPESNRRMRARRKKVKRLMNADVFNEKFPVQKYKTWGALQESLGKATEGGISSDMGLQPLIVDPLLQEQDHDHDQDRDQELGSSDEKTAITQVYTSHLSSETAPSTRMNPEYATIRPPGASEVSTSRNVKQESEIVEHPVHFEHDRDALDSEEVDNDHDIEEETETYVPPAALESPGDTCAICIDTLEPNDDVRALDCHHVFHDECITPWFTTRRACCPLCKRDYYIEPEQDAPQPDAEGHSPASHLPADYQTMYPHIVSPISPMTLLAGRLGHRHLGPDPFPLGMRSSTSAMNSNTLQQDSGDRFQRIRASFPLLRFSRHGRQARSAEPDVEANIQ